MRGSGWGEGSPTYPIMKRSQTEGDGLNRVTALEGVGVGVLL